MPRRAEQPSIFLRTGTLVFTRCQSPASAFSPVLALVLLLPGASISVTQPPRNSLSARCCTVTIRVACPQAPVGLPRRQPAGARTMASRRTRPDGPRARAHRAGSRPRPARPSSTSSRWVPGTARRLVGREAPPNNHLVLDRGTPESCTRSPTSRRTRGSTSPIGGAPGVLGRLVYWTDVPRRSWVPRATSRSGCRPATTLRPALSRPLHA